MRRRLRFWSGREKAQVGDTAPGSHAERRGEPGVASVDENSAGECVCTEVFQARCCPVLLPMFWPRILTTASASVIPGIGRMCGGRGTGPLRQYATTAPAVTRLRDAMAHGRSSLPTYLATGHERCVRRTPTPTASARTSRCYDPASIHLSHTGRSTAPRPSPGSPPRWDFALSLSVSGIPSTRLVERCPYDREEQPTSRGGAWSLSNEMLFFHRHSAAEW